MTQFEIFEGDITKLNVDVIVNAANKALLGGGGVDGAIHSAAGRELLEACLLLNGCKTGDAKITKGFNLPAKFVIHAVGPVWRDGNANEATLLESCYRKSIKLAIDYQLESIAFPAISTGVYSFPKELAAEIAISTTKDMLKTSNQIQKVIFALFDSENCEIYQRILNKA
jgi:O-acetyl-ADP-ribose deacetylase